MALPVAESDAMLVDRARKGDLDAFSVLYSRYFPGVFDFLTRLLRDREEAADVAQDTFIKAMEDLPMLRNPDRFKSWVFTIAHRRGLNRIRSSKRGAVPLVAVDDEERSTMALADTDPRADPQGVAEAREAAHMVWEAAAGLDARTYTVLDLHVRQGLESAEIADVLGVSRATAYTMVSRMKRTFSSSLATYMLVRKGRRECARLAAIVPGETRHLTPEMRRRADRHVAHCAACTSNRSALVAPVKLFASLLLVPLPADLAGAVASGTFLTTTTAAAATAGASVTGAGSAGAGSGAAAGGSAGSAGTSFGLFAGVQGWILGLAAVIGVAASVAAGINLLTDGPAEPEASVPPAVTVPVAAGPDGGAEGEGALGGTTGPPAAGDVIDVDGSETPEAPAEVSDDVSTTAAPSGQVTAAATSSPPASAPTPAAVGDQVVNQGESAVNDAPPVNRSPVVPGPGRLTVVQGETVRFDPLVGAHDADGDALVVSRYDLRSRNGGTIRVGSLIYRPATGFVGTDRFTYDVSDGTATVTVVVEVVVTAAPRPRAPSEPVSPATEVHTAVTIDLVAGWVDPAGRSLTATADTQSAEGGTVTRLDSRRVRYTPPADFTGIDEFGYAVSNGHVSVPAVAKVMVHQPNRDPVIHPFDVETGVSTPLGVSLGSIAADDPDGDDLTFDVVDEGPIHVTSDGEVVVGASLFPHAGTTITVPVTVTDVHDAATEADITVTVDDAHPPVLADAEHVVWSWMTPGDDVGGLDVTDPDEGDHHRFEVIFGDTHGQIHLDEETGRFSLATVVDPSAYPIVLEVQVTDAAGLSDTATVTFRYAEPDPQQIEQFRIRPTMIFAVPAGGVCSDGPTVAGAAALLSRPEDAQRVVLEYHTTIDGAPVSGEVDGYVAGDRALADFSVPETWLGDEDSVEVHFTIRVEGRGGAVATADGERVMVRRCTD